MDKQITIVIAVAVIVIIGITVVLNPFGGPAKSSEKTKTEGPSCPDCSAPSSYSDCNDDAVKTRTNYRCSKSTDFECEEYTEETNCATEIQLTGGPRGGTLGGTVKPSIESKVEGIINIEVTNVPEDTMLVAYFLEGGDLEEMGSGRMPNFATEQGDVWTGMLDTSDYDDGLYTLAVVSTNEEELGDEGPQAYAQAQILIEN